MISTSNDMPLVAVSVSVYRFLLAAYPAKFRQEYGEDMVQLFRDFCLRAVRQNGSEGMVRLWAVTFLDLIQSLFKEHLQKETNVSKSTFIRISGWALILAGIAFLMVFTVWYLNVAYPLMHLGGSILMDSVETASFYGGPVFFCLGLLGLRSRYSETIGAGGSVVLLFSAVVGLIFSLIGILGGNIGLFGGDNEALLSFIYYGPLVQITGLTIFGIIAVQKKPLPWGNGLALLSAAGPLAFIIDAFQIELSSGFSTILNAALLLQFLTTIVIGYILQGDAPQQEAAMAPA